MSDSCADVKRAKIIDKIEKLLALSQSPNENEALAAAEKAQALLAEYNLTMHDIGSTKDPIIKDNDLLTDYAAWIKPLLVSVAKLYFCGYYYEVFPADFIKRMNFDKNARRLVGGWRGKTFLRHSFIGEKVNIIVAKNMAEYLISAMENLCKQEQKEFPANERQAFRLSFMNACASRLCFRLMQRKMETSASGIQGSTNLPALRSIYEQAEEMFQKWTEGEGLKIRQKKSLMQLNHQGGAKAGMVAGDKIGLDDQIKNNEVAGRISSM